MPSSRPSSRADAESAGNVRRLYQLARQTTRGFESYARRLAKRYRNCPMLLEDVLDGLFFVATSDGVITADELAYLNGSRSCSARAR